MLNYGPRKKTPPEDSFISFYSFDIDVSYVEYVNVFINMIHLLFVVFFSGY